MADTLAQFKVRTRRYLKEMNASTSFWNDSVIEQFFNANYRRRCAQLIMAFEGWFVMTAYRDIEEDKAGYGFPDQVQRLQKVEIVREDGTTVPLQRFERHDSPNPGDINSSGETYLPSYRMFGNGILLEPTPTDDITDGLRIEYAGLPAFLDGEGDVLNASFPEIFDELLVIDTVISCLHAEGIHEIGPAASIMSLKAEWEFDWERFIDQRTVSRDAVDPFIGPYSDA